MNPKRTTLVFLVLLLPGAVLMAQARRGAGSPVYDPKTEITAKGTVEEVQQQASGRRGLTGTHLMLKTDSGTFDVHVGPSDYIAKQDFNFAKGDQIEVTGSKVKVGASDVLIAREIKKGGKTLTLRNAQGIPAWSRGRRRPG